MSHPLKLRRAAVAAAAIAAALCFPLAADGKEPPPGPVKIIKWSMRWDRFGKKGIVEATFKNNSPKRVSKVNVDIEFLDDNGKVAKKTSWYASTIYSFGTGKMKRTLFNCPIFQRYRIRLKGVQEEKDVEQYFEGRYWPDKPGDDPELPKPIVLAKGAADVRVIASREELKKRGRRKESLKITGTVQNLGDCPAENIEVVIKLILEETTKAKGKKRGKVKEKPEKEKKKKTAKEIRCRVPTSRLEPNRTASFSTFLKQLPDYTTYDYEVEFDSVGGPVAEAETEVKPFELQAGPLVLKDCTLAKKDGLFKGTLINQGKKGVTDVIVSIKIEKKGKNATHEIKPGGVISPGAQVSLIKATTPGYEKFSVDVQFEEKE
jgi:hypothetical protein